MTTTQLPNLNFRGTAKSAFSPIMTAIAGSLPNSNAPTSIPAHTVIQVLQADGSNKWFAFDLSTMTRVEISAAMARDWTSEWTPQERAEIRLRYEEAEANPLTVEYARNAPNLLEIDW